MKPRIFISSTCYDLKFVREDLADFVREYDYEPILSENGDIGYTPGQNLDKSCYAAMQTADMVILIIGSEYGSAASGEKKDEFKEYISITRNEFRTAVESGIPIFVMIDKKVMAEYGVYEANYDDIEKENRMMVFPTTKNINVFRFIKEIKGIVTLPIQEFEKSLDIKGFVSKQWADMFKSYLASLRNEKEDKKIENSVNEMKALIQKMDIMLDSVGKNVLSKENPDEYKNVVNQQDVLMFCNTLVRIFTVYILDKELYYNIKDKEIMRDLLKAFKEVGDETERISDFRKELGCDTKKIFREFQNKWKCRIILMGNDDLLEIIFGKDSLLYNDENMDNIVDMLSTGEYSRRLISRLE